MLEWASISNEELHVTQKDDKIDSDREETRAKFEEYFAQTGRRAFFSLPLADDDGRVGILAFESSDPDFLTPAHIEMIRILAGQATVALRNASLYKEVPLISVLEPLLEKKRKFLALEKRRRAVFLAATVAAVLILTFLPIPMRVDGSAAVAPARIAQIRPQFGGVVSKVYVHEGQRVQAGDILADLADWNYRDALAAAQAKYAITTAEMNRALAANDGTEAGIQRAQVAYWAAEVDRARQRLEAAHLRTPIDGWVTTPRVEDLVGEQLSPGDKFAEVAEASRSTVDVAIDEVEVDLLQVGRWGEVKLDAFPTRTLRGKVDVVSPTSEAKGEDRIFYARVDIPNDGSLRSGMQGRAKISVGWHPVGYVLFRRISMWAYGKLWSWFGWW
jgi:RND family efflux transporter MFP subunit